MSNSVFEQIHTYAKYLGLDLDASEIAQVSASQNFSDAQLHAIESIFSYLRDKKEENIVATLLRMSRLPTKEPKTFENFDFSQLHGKQTEAIKNLPTLSALYSHTNLAFIGPQGVGKTHLATSIGIVAAKNRDSTYFINCNDLIANLKKANSENRFMNRLNHYSKYKLLIIDEVGYLPLDIESANMLFQLISKRYEKSCTIITTNKPFSKWNEIFGDITVANAILDRLLHHSHVINITGRSYRIKDKIKEVENKST